MSHDHHTEEHHGHHIIPIKTLSIVFGALVALTIITVLSAQLDLGSFNVPLALLIALTKGSLVVAIFMGLKYDNKVNTMVFATGTIFVVVFIVFTLFDTAFRGDLSNVDDMTIMEQEREEEALRSREPAPEALRVAPADFPQDEAGDSSDVEANDSEQ